jgi:serine/threonine-protein kinase
MASAATQVGDYQINRILVTRGMHSVYEGLHAPLRRPVLMEANALGSVPGMGNALLERAAALAKLHHPAIATLLDYQAVGTTHYFISEYAGGVSLQEYLHTLQAPLPERECYALFNRILEGFAYLHRQQVAHGQVHPAFIGLLQEGGVKIFGLGTTNVPGENGWSGTPAPTAPRDAYTPPGSTGRPGGTAADVYALGILLQEMLLGQPASPGRPAGGKTNYLPSAVHAIIRKATHPDPRERFPNAVALQKAWQQVATLSPEATPGESKPFPEAAADPSAGKRRRGTSRIEMPLLLLVLALVIAAGFALHLKQSNRTPSVSQAPHAGPADEDRGSGAGNPGEAAETASSAEAAMEEPLVDSTALPVEDAEAENDEQAYVKAALREQMEGYYAALRAKDAETLLQYFNPPLGRFFNERNVTETQLRAFLRQSWQRTPESRHDIIWNTMRYGKDEAGNHVVDYWMYYHYRRANRDGWRKQIVFTRLKLDQHLKIIAMNGH